nr:putative ribonuclease H-like domain-containing protein [Tanacetum cinerariifolium]
MAYNDKYKKILNEIWRAKVELVGKTVKEEEDAVKRIKGEAFKEKDYPGAFIFPIRLEGKVNKNALADTRLDINIMPYRIYESLGREEVKKIDRGITMINHTQAKAMGKLSNVLSQVRATTIIAKFLILNITIDLNAAIVVVRVPLKQVNWKPDYKGSYTKEEEAIGQRQINEGYVAFGGNPKGGKIIGKAKIMIDKLDFDDVYFVKELKFNLFSVSQMCDKKNSVLFTDTECLVLSSDFKLPDENHVLLRVPRENNMYNVDLKNIVSLGYLTCLFVKATLDESNIWHGRPGHINFKTMNKLVKGNLVRGLTSKVFENNHTCVACKKDKKHRASCKSKPASSVSQPLQRMKGIKREFSVARTLQQNRVAERKNRTLIEAARTMLADSLLPIPFWAEAVNTTYYVQNRVLVTKPHNKTPYELLLGRTPSLGFIRPFRCPVTIFNTLDPLGKFDGKADEGYLVGYSVRSKAFRVFNRNQPNSSAGIQGNFNACKVGKESISTQQYVLLPLWYTSSKDPYNIDVDAAFDDKENESKFYVSPRSSDKPKKHDEKAKREAKGKSPVDFAPATAVGPNSTNNTNSFNVAGSFDNAVSLNFEIGGKSSFVNPSQYPDDPDMPALEDIVYSDDEEDVGVEADFSILETSIHVILIPTTRVYKNHHVTQIISDLSLAPQTRSMIRMVKEQGFKDPDYPDKVYKVVKALYGLHQAPRAWYEPLANYLLKSGFQRGKIDQTLFIKKQKAFEKLMKDKFQMSSMGELTFFLGLQVKQKDNGIFISQDKYVAEILRKFGLTDGKIASTPIDTEKPLLKDLDGEDVDLHIYRSMIGSLMYLTSSRMDIMFSIYACACFQVTPKVSHLHAVKKIFRYLKGKPHLGLWYPKDSPFNLVAYSDSDYARASLDMKSTTGGCQFQGCILISWQCKKQTVVVTSSTKAEYVVVKKHSMKLLEWNLHVTNVSSADYCCSGGSHEDKIIYDLNQTPDLSQRSRQNCPKCGNPVDGHFCQGCALLRKKVKEDLFTYCIENEILQDSSEPSNDNTSIVNALQESFVVN